MATNRQYFPVSTFKTQATSFMTPAILRRTDGTNFPVEYMELPGRGNTTAKTGFFFEAPMLFTLGAVSIFFKMDFFPVVEPSVGGGSLLVIFHADIAATNNDLASNVLTDAFVVNPSTGASGIYARGTYEQAQVTVASGSQQDAFAAGKRATIRIYREPLNVSDTYPDSIGVTGVWMQYDDV